MGELEQNLVGIVDPYDSTGEVTNAEHFLKWSESYASTPPDPNDPAKPYVRDPGDPNALRYPETPPPGWELVYKGQVAHVDGTINEGGDLVIREIDEARNTPITFFDYFNNKGEGEDYIDFILAKDYQQAHTEQAEMP
jgi:hypothetical protein